MSTLKNFGIHPQGKPNDRGILHPKHQYRFRITAYGMGRNRTNQDTTYFTRQVMTAQRPNMSSTDIQLHSYNSTSYVMGKHEWQPLTIELRDDLGNHATKIVGEQMQKQLDHRTQLASDAGENYKFDMLIEMMDGNSDVALETWRIEGAFIQAADYTQLDYSVSDAVRISLTIRFDNAYQEEPGLMDKVGEVGDPAFGNGVNSGNITDGFSGTGGTPPFLNTDNPGPQ